MATYTKVLNSIPNSQRSALITDVAAGDKIDLNDVLGRAARTVIFIMTDAADEIEYKINHLRKISAPREQPLTEVDKVYGVFGQEQISVWHGHSDTYLGTGGSQLQITSGLNVASLEVMSLTLNSGSTISIAVT